MAAPRALGVGGCEPRAPALTLVLAILIVLGTGGIGRPAVAPPTLRLSWTASPALRSAEHHAAPAARPSPVLPRGAAAPLPSGPGPVWRSLNVTGPFPMARQQAGWSWDESDGYFLLFGGFNRGTSAAVFNDSWAYNRSGWNELAPPVSPSARAAFSMAYDPADDCIVLFGGWDDVNDLNDTWEFHGGRWSELRTPVAPSPRDSGMMAWDPVLGALVLFGGGNGTRLLNDTWTFVHGIWSPREAEPNTPRARVSAAFAYSPSDRALVLFGGQYMSRSTGLVPLNDTWEWSNGTWTALLETASPSARAFVLFAPTTGTALALYGGLGPVAVLNGSFLFSNGRWENVTANSLPGPRFAYEFGFDPELAEPVLLGGQSGNDTLHDLWALDAPSVNLTASRTLSVAPTTIFLSSNTSGGIAPYVSTWSYSDGSPSYVGDPTSHRFNVDGRFTVSVETVDRAGASARTNLSVLIDGFAVVWSSAAAPNDPLAVTLSARATNGTGPYTYNWSFGDGTFGSGAVVLHGYGSGGLYDVQVEVADSLGWNSSAGGILDLSVPPLSVAALARPLDGPAPLQVSFSAIASGGVPPVAYAWTFGDGQGASTANSTELFGSPGNYSVSVLATDVAGEEARWNGSVNVSAVPGSIGASPRVLEAAVGAALAVGAAAVALWAWRRRRSP